MDGGNRYFDNNGVGGNLGKILLPLAFLLTGFILTCAIPQLLERRRLSRQRQNGTNETLSEDEINDALVTKYVLPHEICYMFPEISQKREKWWKKFRFNSYENTQLKLLRKLRSETNKRKKCCSKDDSELESSASMSSDGFLVCQICVEPFAVGDKVALPKFQSCDHVFHQKCIKTWLKRNNTCPCCRCTYIDKEKLQNDSNSYSLKKLFKKLFKFPTVYNEMEQIQFCQVHGVIRPGSYDEENLDNEMKTISLRSTDDLNV
jgi:hypothetical protein